MRVVTGGGDGRLLLHEAPISTGQGVPSVVVNGNLMDRMDLARVSIGRFAREERSLPALTVSVPAKGAGRTRAKLDQARRETMDGASAQPGGTTGVPRVTIGIA